MIRKNYFIYVIFHLNNRIKIRPELIRNGWRSKMYRSGLGRWYSGTRQEIARGALQKSDVVSRLHALFEPLHWRLWASLPTGWSILVQRIDIEWHLTALTWRSAFQEFCQQSWTAESGSIFFKERNAVCCHDFLHLPSAPLSRIAALLYAPEYWTVTGCWFETKQHVLKLSTCWPEMRA